MHVPRHRTRTRKPPQERWREACVDGVLHVAFAAAERAEAAAHHCARTIARRPVRRRHSGRRTPWR